MAELDTDRIAEAALAIVVEQGVAGFTMRAVADALGVTPMALYHHVRDKAELAALVVDADFSRHPLPQPTGAWREDLWAMARWLREGRMARPAVLHLSRAYRVWTPTILHMTECWLSLWQQSGLDLDDAVLAAMTSVMTIGGLVDEQMMLKEMAPPSQDMLTFLPNVRLMFELEHDPDAQFELAVRSFIDGLHARLLAQRRNSAGRARAKTGAQRNRPKRRLNSSVARRS